MLAMRGTRGQLGSERKPLHYSHVYAYTLIKKHESRNFLLFRESLNLSTAPRDEEMAFVGGGGKRRVVVGQPWNEKARPARCVCTRGVPNESNSPVMFLRVMKRENNVIQAEARLYYIVGRMQGKLHLSTLRISSLSRFDSTILQTLYLNDIKFSPIGTLRR